MKIRMLAVCTFLLFLIGCSRSITQVNFLHESVEIKDVVLYYTEKPDCNFETIGYLQTDGGYYSLKSMFENMKNDASQIGATGVYITQTQKLDIGEYTATALAIRCEPLLAQTFYNKRQVAFI